jgi:hypothetical protein
MSRRCIVLAAVVAFALVPAAAEAQTGVCRDPWVTELVKEIARREPRGSGESGECNVNLYGASWGSKDDLRAKVRQTFNAMRSAGVSFENTKGTVFADVKMNVNIQASSVYVGPRANAPAGKFYVDLPNGYAIAFTRARCYANSNRGC